MQKLLSCIEIDPATPACGTVILMHGLGADGSDFVDIIPQLNLPKLPLRFVFPNAPTIPVTINNGYVMRAWYDIFSLTIERHADQAGITQSIEKIHALIKQEEKRGILPKNIILAGFSQGAVIALAAGLTYPDALGGIIALSGYLPYADEILLKATKANQSIPIFLGHGSNDTIVPHALGENILQLLKQNHYPVESHTYPIAHSVCSEEIKDIANFLTKIYAPPLI